MTRPSAKPFFPNVNLRAIHAELKRQTVEIRQCSPPPPEKMGRGVFATNMMDCPDGSFHWKRHCAIFCLDCLPHRQIAHP